MRFEMITLFPEVLAQLDVGLLGRAQSAGKFEAEALSPREFSKNRYGSVDDSPYGGGSGMVLAPGPIMGALEALDERRGGPTRRILLTPQGRPFDQKTAERLALEPCLTFICGRYEGFDERIRPEVHEELSLGDFVLLGGESAALTMIEAVARLLPGVLGNAESAIEESHSMGLLEHPQYTRPAEFRGQQVPKILLSGNHAAIRRWRRKEALRRTLMRRPDMLETHDRDKDDDVLLAEIRAELADEDQE